MSRQIKFRAWDKSLKLYKYPSLWDNSMPSNWQHWYILQQYTGMKDKNGKEIYEGDVITTPVRLAQENHDATGQVQFLGTGFVSAGLGEYRGGHYPIQYNSEIIGNIYENPELITPSGHD